MLARRVVQAGLLPRRQNQLTMMTRKRMTMKTTMRMKMMTKRFMLKDVNFCNALFRSNFVWMIQTV